MSNLQHITSKIKNDSEVQKNSIINQASQKASEIVNKKESAAKKDAADLIQRGKKEAITKKERIISSVTLKVRNEKLVAKQKVINEVFLKAQKELETMDTEKFKTFVKDKIMSLNIDGDESIILNSSNKNAINENFLKEINSALKAMNKKGELKISKIEGNFKGGFILEKDGVEINYTFESLINSLREEMEFEIANIIFN